MQPIRIGLIGDFSERHRAHTAVPTALQAASKAVETVWVATDSVGNSQSLADLHGLWCVPGLPYRSAEGAMAAIRHARITRTPFLGTSGGFQYAILEFARDVLGLSEAGHQEVNPKSPMPLIAPLNNALSGVKARVRFLDGSRLRSIYGAPDSVEEYHCSFGLNERYRRLIEGGELSVAAVDDRNEVRAVELDRHPFFIATLFEPERRAGQSPLVQAFVECSAGRQQGGAKAAG